MSLLSVFFIGVGLAMDACAVSFAKGMCLKKKVFRYAWILAFAFGLFQAGMPLLGWWIGHYFEGFITAVDHWIAFILLGTIGFHMIKEAKEPTDESECPTTAIPLKDIIILAVATSIDALAVGISFAFLQVDILSAVIIIGITTFIISFVAVIMGNRCGGHMGTYAEVIGGIILIAIGLKILLEHLTA